MDMFISFAVIALYSSATQISLTIADGYKPGEY